MKENIRIKANDLTKIFKLYNKQTDRIKEALSPRSQVYHRDFYALNQISFEIGAGETVGIVGKNGAGKSTLLKILTEVLTPTTGEMVINGKVSALLELGSGFNPEYTGLKNIYLNGTIMGLTRSEIDARVDDIVNFADIGDYIYQPVKLYSSGMFVRLAFAVATNVDPDILIVDEALAVGDIRFQLKCMDKFLEFKEKGITILYVSHDVNSIKRFCDRAIWLNEGKIQLDGNVDYVTDQYLDYLKMLDNKVAEEKSHHIQVVNQEKEENIINGNIDIAALYKVRILNSKEEEIDRIQHGEEIIVEVEYIVNDISVENPVLGIAILRIDNLYICGVNTLLDKQKIPWKKGRNKYRLKYKEFTLVGGSYYFDVAIYDQTATVPIDYRSKYKEFFVDMEYTAEGIAILNHRWIEG
jgi:ABC-type polysaccharide/polyol phosphate transport system ATPase subunit